MYNNLPALSTSNRKKNLLGLAKLLLSVNNINEISSICVLCHDMTLYVKMICYLTLVD